MQIGGVGDPLETLFEMVHDYFVGSGFNRTGSLSHALPEKQREIGHSIHETQFSVAQCPWTCPL